MANYYGETITKYPITIPFYWVRLNIERLFKNPGKTKKKMKSMSDISDNQKERTRQLFDMCGLK